MNENRKIWKPHFHIIEISKDLFVKAFPILEKKFFYN